MPVQAPQWTDFLSCPICCNGFECNVRRPISLGCGHTMCKSCLSKLQRKQCPFDQTIINTDIKDLPENFALLQLVGGRIPEKPPSFVPLVSEEDLKHYLDAKKCIEELALYLKPTSPSAHNGIPQNSPLSRPMQRKLITLINCQLVEEEGRTRGMRAARSIGERSVTELILQHQNPQQLSANLWAAVRARGCQFLGPAMQEEVLKLILLALEDGSALSRKVLVMFVVQRLASHFPQASKTSIGHVVQLLYRASCFKVSKKEGDSSLMELKEDFRTYETLRREHDAQIVQIATEAGLRIAPEQWSSLLYGDTAHKSHMQSVIDKLQTPQSFSQNVQELVIALQRTGDPGNLSVLRPHFDLLAGIDPSPYAPPPRWEDLKLAQEAALIVVKGLFNFVQNFGSRKLQDDHQNLHAKYKTSMCRDVIQKGSCVRGSNCTYAHSEEELEKYRAKNKYSFGNRNSCSNARKLNSESTLSSNRNNTTHANSSLMYNMRKSPSTAELNTKSDCSVPCYVFDGVFVPESSLCTSSVMVPSSSSDEFYNIQSNKASSLSISSTILDSNPSSHMLNAESSAFQPLAEEHQVLPMQSPILNTNLCSENQSSSFTAAVVGVIPTALTGVPATRLKLSNNYLSQQTGRISNSFSSHASSSVPRLQSNTSAVHHKDSVLLNSSLNNQFCLLKTVEDGNNVPFHSLQIPASSFQFGSPSCSSNSFTSLNSPSNEEDSSLPKDDFEKEISEMVDAACALFCPSERDEFIPFDPPLVSKYGPISRCSKSLIRGPAPILVNTVSQMGGLTSPTSVVRHPLPSASVAPSFNGTISPTFAVAIIPEQYLPVVESASVVLPVTPGHTVYPSKEQDSGMESTISKVCESKKNFVSNKNTEFSGREKSNTLVLKEELCQVNESIHERERNTQKNSFHYIKDSNKQKDDYKSGVSVPTSIGPWPLQTLKTFPFKQSDNVATTQN